MKSIPRFGLFLLVYLALPALLSLAAAEKSRVDVILWFDTEDYLLPADDDACKRLAEMLRIIGELEIKYALRCVNVFHAGDGNLHPLILFDANDPDEMHRCELFGAEILETSISLGGTVTGEHGVGVEKLNSMCVQFSAAERAQMLAVKNAFDPAGLLNPGKAIPSLQRCAEYGKMHVHRGALKFPDLPRF